MIMAKKLMLFSAAVVACGSLFANGNPITWKGGGDTPRWSDGSNWEGGVAPEKGDIAVIPEDTTAYASHYSDERGDLTLIKSLAGISLAGTNAVFLLDDQLDDNGSFDFAVPLSGNGVFIFTNTVQNTRQMTLKADNSAFTGRFRFLRSRVYVCHTNALGVSGNSIEFKPNNGQHAISYQEPGVYSNHIFVTGSISGSGPTVSGGVAGVTNLGSVVVMPGGSITLSSIYVHCITNNTGSVTATGNNLRFGVGLTIGKGGSYGFFRTSANAKVYVLGPITHCGGDAYSFAMMNQDSGASLVCLADHVLDGQNFQVKKSTFDLNGHDQGGVRIYGSDGSVITSSVPASITWSGAYGGGDATSDIAVNGKATLIVDPGAGYSGRKLTLSSGAIGTRGGLEARRGKLAFAATCAAPNVRRLASMSADKYNLSYLIFNSVAFNPGRVDLESASDYGKVEVSEGLQLDVRTFKSAGKYVKAGIYGSAVAQEAGTVDADHVLPCLAGLGTVKVELDGPPGMMLILR